jgi:asparagine synthase (glutamine-hydrolysing)
MARRHVTVALSGDGGDEIFGGYNSYRFAHLIRQYHRLPARVRDLITETADRMPAPVVSNNLKRRIRLLQMTPELQHTRASFFKEDERQLLFQPGVVPTHTGERLKRDALARMDGYDWLTQLQYVDLVGYMPVDILVKVDRASMLNSLEVRCPLLDRDIFEFMASVPPQYKFNGRRTKIILREAVKDLLPPEVFTRRKMGFGVPVGRWFRGPLRLLVEDMLLSDRAKARGLFNPDYVRRIVSEHNEGIMDRVNPIWALLCFEMWAREYLDIPEAMPV